MNILPQPGHIDLERLDLLRRKTPDDEIKDLSLPVEDHQPAVVVAAPKDVVIPRIGAIKYLTGRNLIGKGPNRGVDIIDLVLPRVVGHRDPTRRIDRFVREVLDFEVVGSSGSCFGNQDGRLLRAAFPGRIIEIERVPIRIQRPAGNQVGHFDPFIQQGRHVLCQAV